VSLVIADESTSAQMPAWRFPNRSSVQARMCRRRRAWPPVHFRRFSRTEGKRGHFPASALPASLASRASS